MVRKSLYLLSILILLLLVTSFLPVSADSMGSINAIFSVNSKPLVGFVSLISTVDPASTTPLTMTPQTEYTVSVQITDYDTINDLSSVVLKLYYDTNNSTDKDEFDSKSDDSDGKEVAVITWTADDPGGDTYTSSVALEPSDSTWSLGACILPKKGQGQQAGDFGHSIFTFYFVFMVGKKAAETTGSARWQIAVTATDRIQTDWNTVADGVGMNFYGEIVIFSSIADSCDFQANAHIENETQVSSSMVRVVYVANGNCGKGIRESVDLGNSIKQTEESCFNSLTYIITKALGN